MLCTSDSSREQDDVQGVRLFDEERWPGYAGVYRLLREQPRSIDLQPCARTYHYKRRYLDKRRYLGEKLTAEGGEVDFDVMTELIFADSQAFEAWMAELAKPGVGIRIVEDEEKFLNRARTRAYVIEERITRE